MIGAMNPPDRGRCGTSIETMPPPSSSSDGATPCSVHGALHLRVLRESARLERWRSSSGSIGVQAVAQLLKISPLACYGSRGAASAPRAKLVAQDIDEPNHSRVVEMLEWLPNDESAYYGRKSKAKR